MIKKSNRQPTLNHPIIYAFIDSQNLNLSIQDQGWQLDFHRFRVYLKDKYHVKAAFLFIGKIPGNTKLYRYLSRCGYKLVYKPIIAFKAGNKVKVKGNVDAELVLHAMIEFPHYHQAIIISGDGDFHCLIEYLLKKRKLARVLVPNRRKYSQLLLDFRPHLDFLNNLKPKLAQSTNKKGSVALRTKP